MPFLVSEQADTVVNGDASNGETPHKKWDVIVITGKRENCEGAKEALQVGNDQRCFLFTH